MHIHETGCLDGSSGNLLIQTFSRKRTVSCWVNSLMPHPLWHPWLKVDSLKLTRSYLKKISSFTDFLFGIFGPFFERTFLESYFLISKVKQHRGFQKALNYPDTPPFDTLSRKKYPKKPEVLNSLGPCWAKMTMLSSATTGIFTMVIQLEVSKVILKWMEVGWCWRLMEETYIF